jgi:hypothetical protein
VLLLSPDKKKKTQKDTFLAYGIGESVLTLPFLQEEEVP